ncbi:MAG: hypothetical protein WDN24_10685 [Sphingomonas sp.]
MNPANKQVYRRIRNLWGWIIAAVWVVFWYFRLNSHGAGECETMVAAAGCQMVAGFGIILALLTAPFAFVVSHYIARSVAERRQRGEDDRDRHAAEQAKAKLDADREEQRRILEAQDADTRRAMDRKVFIQKIGTARDALSAQAHETDPARQALAAQQVSAGLRDLVTRFDLQEMTQLIRTDHSVALLVRALIEDLRNSMQFPPEALLLERALGPGSAETPPQTPSPPPARSKYRNS